ncbi:hypothetical protein E2C01_047249 [Portunus trituberculatus]|uniref:Uncharacterized protein n=1 Tax=Portunus trituberculatus TaxID=210409 RepID=A0A5B7FZY6_PORTR|nr:hypothetical protein [Portunus trituberculatus]
MYVKEKQQGAMAGTRDMIGRRHIAQAEIIAIKLYQTSTAKEGLHKAVDEPVLFPSHLAQAKMSENTHTRHALTRKREH